MATLGGSTRSNGPHVAALPPAEANANSDGVIKDSFDKKMRLLPFCMCEQALTFTGPSDALGVEWANSKSALAVGTMKFLARTVHSGVIEDRAHNQCADHYVTTFFMYAFLMKLPHLITPNIKVIGVTGIRSINALVSLCTQFEETENNELHWERKEVGPEKFEPVGFKSKEPSRNALVGECIADAMEYFEALCHGDTAKVNELKPKLISLLQNINNICNDLNPKPMVPAKVKKQDTNPIAHKGALTIDILHWEGETNGRKLWIPEIPLRQTVLAEQRVDAWRDQRGDTQLALFCLSFPGKPLHTFLCRFMCASLNSVEEVERKAEEIMAAVDATTRRRFINFVKKATHCLGSTPQSFLGNGNNNEDQAESIRIFLESAAGMLAFLNDTTNPVVVAQQNAQLAIPTGPPQVVDLTEDMAEIGFDSSTMARAQGCESSGPNNGRRAKPVSPDDFDKSLALINFRLCEEAKNWKGSPIELLNKWIPLEVGDVAEDRDNAKLGGVPDHCLARASMQIMISSFFAGAIPSQYRKSEHFAEQYFKSFFIYSLLTSLPHLITPNIKLIGLPGFNNISEFLDVSVQIKEQHGHQLTWESGQNGHGFVGASDKESRNGLVGECLVAALRYFEGRCDDTTNNEEFQRAIVDLRQRLIDLLRKIKEISAELEIKPLNVAKIGELKSHNVARGLTIHVLQSGMEYREMMKEQEKVPSKKEFEDARPTGFAKESWKLLHEVLDTGDLSKWASKEPDEDKIAKKGETQLALFCLGWPDSPLHTYLCRWMCASLNSVKEVRETAEEMMAKANVDAEEQRRFIDFVEGASRCLGSKSLAPVVGISDIRDGQEWDQAWEQAEIQEQEWRIDQESRMTEFIGSSTKLLGFLQRLEEEAKVGGRPDFLQRQREAHLLAEEEANVGERQDDNPEDGDDEDNNNFFDKAEFSCEGNADQMPRRNGQPARVDALLQDTTIGNKGAKSDVAQQHARQLLEVPTAAIAMDQAKEELQGATAEMGRKWRELRSQLEDACGREDDLKAKLQSAENGRYEALSQLGNVQHELKAARAQRSEANSKLADVQAQNQSTVADKERAESQLKESQEQLNTVLASRDALTEELAKSKDREESLKAQVDSVTRALDTGERALDTGERALRDSQEARDRLEAELSNSKKENERLEKQAAKMKKTLADKQAKTSQEETAETSTATAPDACASFGEQSAAKVSKEGDQMTGDGIAGIDEPRQKTKRDATEGHSKSQGNGNINNQRSKKQRLESSVTIESPCTNRGSSSTGQVRVKCESVPASAPGNPPVKKKYDPEVLMTAVVKKEC